MSTEDGQVEVLVGPQRWRDRELGFLLLCGIREVVWIIGFVVGGELVVVIVVVVVVVTVTGLVIVVRSARFTRCHCEVG